MIKPLSPNYQTKETFFFSGHHPVRAGNLKRIAFADSQLERVSQEEEEEVAIKQILLLFFSFIETLESHRCYDCPDFLCLSLLSRRVSAFQKQDSPETIKTELNSFNGEKEKREWINSFPYPRESVHEDKPIIHFVKTNGTYLDDRLKMVSSDLASELRNFLHRVGRVIN